MTGSASPLVSIVIPTYNHAHYLSDALQSVFDQSYTNWEVIVIDNHSSDDTDAVMARFSDPRITFIKTNNNGVIAASRNIGIRIAKGDWIAFLDSDDWWKTNKLKFCIDHSHDKVDLIYHGMKIVRTTFSPFQQKYLRNRQLQKPVFLDLLLGGNAIANSSVVVRKKLLERIGGIDVDVEMIASEDYNTWLRIAQITDGFVKVPHSLGFYRIHNQGTSQRDMSLPIRRAISSFTSDLSNEQQARIESSLQYTHGRFEFLQGNYIEARHCLVRSLRYGSIENTLKSILMLFVLVYRLRMMQRQFGDFRKVDEE